MKARWLILLGRVGSILLVIGLSLTLISLNTIASKTLIIDYRIRRGEYDYRSPAPMLCHPSRGFRLSLTSNNSLQLYIITMAQPKFRDWTKSWVREHYPSLDESQVSRESLKVPVLEAFLQAHPGDVLRIEGAGGKWSIEFFPPKVANITIVSSNSFNTSASYNAELTPISTLIPRQYAVPTAEVLIAFGVVSALPLAVMKSKGRIRSDRTKV